MKGINKMNKVDWKKALVSLLTKRDKLTDKELGDCISILEQAIHDLVYENRQLLVEKVKVSRKALILRIIIDNKVNIRKLEESNCVEEYIASGENFLYPEEFELLKEELEK